ncbi:arsenosugar biosynthesis radical SAM (seleno)protein ArsS [Sediminitomix flava]|uniref:Radical SAM/Cys-rich protein n=1 Tax=Sediminitomix flava TaxID=379075 RepID=A0A315ZHD1_SEDFL|nr:arsenosugar biosynthesis radical SAM (seleno)protein ArsS [Sediminitomix flava]PWJ44560.1 radical SAM/Cys-rich protein [Sediminitomix flava]
MTVKSLQSRAHILAKTEYQKELLSADINFQEKALPFFSETLKTHGHSDFLSGEIEILQINLGKMCNQVCEHCHVDAGPDREEIMTKETMEFCLAALKDSTIQTVDLTGGAPEMNPHFLWFVEEIRKLGKEVIVRSNLTILNANNKYKTYPSFFKEMGVTVISSLPCYTESNTDKQRGDGVFKRSIDALKTLNALGYGKEGSDFELHLVYNPGGASLPGSQEGLERDYKRELMENFGISFNQLFTITNLPISRFLDFLIQKNKYEEYLNTLIEAFNPAAVNGVMCKNTISVSWDGYLYDCDFNQMLEMKVSEKAPEHIKDFSVDKLTQRTIQVNRHCFGCTAGAGSSCQGTIV